MKKLTKFLLIVAIVLLLIAILLSNYVKDSENISKLVGSKIGGGELSMSNYYSLSQCVKTYINYLAQKDYETAYKMLNNNYKEYVSFEEFKDEVSNKNYSKTVIENIDIVTSSTFQVFTDTEGIKELFTIIVNKQNNNFILLPNTFLDYKEINKKQDKNQLNCELKTVLTEVGKCSFTLIITNNSNESTSLNYGEMYTSRGEKIKKELDVNIQPKESKQIIVVFETSYDFPEKLILSRQLNDKKTVDYSFNLNQ